MIIKRKTEYKKNRKFTYTKSVSSLICDQITNQI